MSLLDDAHRLAAHDLRDHDDIGGYGFCPLCEEPTGHRPDCPWNSMPAIVTALEAVEEALLQLQFLDQPAFREDRRAVLSLADRVRALLVDELA